MRCSVNVLGKPMIYHLVNIELAVRQDLIARQHFRRKAGGGPSHRKRKGKDGRLTFGNNPCV